MPDTTKPFSCAVFPRRQAVHVCPVGELDLSTAPEVDARLAEVHLAGFDKVVLDLSGVTFCDSSGVHLVVQWSRRSAEERFDFAVIVGSDVVERVLQLTGVMPQLLDGAHRDRQPHVPQHDRPPTFGMPEICGGTLPDPTT